MTTHNPADDFEAARKVLDELKNLPRDRQERVLRWASEALGLISPSTHSAPHTPPVVQRIATPEPHATGAGTDIKTFVAAKAPKSDNQFAAVVAYYYRFEAPPAQRRDSIDPDALQEATRLAGRQRLAKPLATLNHAKGVGYLDNSARGQFTINSVGENLVAMALPGDAGVSPGKAKKKARASAKK